VLDLKEGLVRTCEGKVCEVDYQLRW